MVVSITLLCLSVQPKMMALLGKEKFDKYAIKIWQLKFCEESFFMC